MDLFPCSASSEQIPCVPGAQDRFHCLWSPRAFSECRRFSCRVSFHAWPWQMLESSPSALGVLFAAAALPSPGQRALHQPRMLYEPPSRPLTQGRARLRGWNTERALSSVKITRRPDADYWCSVRYKVTFHQQPGAAGSLPHHSWVDPSVLLLAVPDHQPVDQLVVGHVHAVFCSVLDDAAVTHPCDVGHRVCEHTLKEGIFAFLRFDLLDFYNKFHIGHLENKEKRSMKVVQERLEQGRDS